MSEPPNHTESRTDETGAGRERGPSGPARQRRERETIREGWNARYAASELVWSADPYRFLVEEIKGLTPGRALDLACGEGRNAIWLAEQGWTATAVDFSEVAVDKGRQIGRDRGVEIDWAVHDVTTWTPPTRSFDLVIIFYLQLPIGWREGVWARAADAVAPRGTFLLVAHDSRNLSDGSGGPQSADVLHTAADVTPHLDGFEIARAGEVLRSFEPEHGEMPRPAIDCLVRARRVSD
jgi:SAM-dependent methyltransferase